MAITWARFDGAPNENGTPQYWHAASRQWTFFVVAGAPSSTDYIPQIYYNGTTSTFATPSEGFLYANTAPLYAPFGHPEYDVNDYDWRWSSLSFVQRGFGDIQFNRGETIYREPGANTERKWTELAPWLGGVPGVGGDAGSGGTDPGDGGGTGPTDPTDPPEETVVEYPNEVVIIDGVPYNKTRPSLTASSSTPWMEPEYQVVVAYIASANILSERNGDQAKISELRQRAADIVERMRQRYILTNNHDATRYGLSPERGRFINSIYIEGADVEED